MEELDPRWRKASYSGNGGGSCVEVANAARVVLVRDSKNPAGATLSIPADAWSRLTAEIRQTR